jgi:hypothetical protein
VSDAEAAGTGFEPDRVEVDREAGPDDVQAEVGQDLCLVCRKTAAIVLTPESYHFRRRYRPENPSGPHCLCRVTGTNRYRNVMSAQLYSIVRGSAFTNSTSPRQVFRRTSIARPVTRFVGSEPGSTVLLSGPQWPSVFFVVRVLRMHKQTRASLGPAYRDPSRRFDAGGIVRRC